MAANENPQKENEAPTPRTPKQDEDLRNLKIARAIVLRKVTDSDLEKTLQGVPKENGKYRTYYGVLLRDVFRSLASTFDPNFQQSFKNSYTREELKEYLEHFEHATPGFETHLENAIDALEHGKEPPKQGEKPGEGEQEREPKEKEKKEKEEEHVQEHPIEEEVEENEEEETEGEEESQVKTSETPKTEIIDNPQAGPSRGQRIRDFGSRIPLGRVSQRLFSPLLIKIGSFMEKRWVIAIPAAAGAAIGGVMGGPQMALLGGMFGGAFGAAAVKPIVEGGRGNQEKSPEPALNEAQPEQTPSPQEQTPSSSQDDHAPQRRTPPPSPPTPSLGSNALAETARFAMSFPGARVWLIIGLIGLASIIWITMQAASNGSFGSSGGASTSNPGTGATAQVSVIKAQQNCKSEKDYCIVTNGSDITYVITVTYLGQGAGTIEVDDTLPPKTTFKNAPGGENQGGTVKWVLSNVGPNQTKYLTLTITPGSDVWVVNKATASVSQAPNNNTCGGKYTLTNHESGVKNPLGNFGDSSCNYTKEQLYTLLKQNDPANADFWFNAVVKCESGYDPTDWRDPNLVPHTPDSHGAFGLFQMGMGDSSNGPLDNGAVNWPKQVTNAVGYKNQKLGGKFGYWACAK